VCTSGRRLFYLLHLHKCASTTMCHLAVGSDRIGHGLHDNCNPWSGYPDARCVLQRIRRARQCQREGESSPVALDGRVCSTATGPDPWNVWLRTSDLAASRCACLPPSRIPRALLRRLSTSSLKDVPCSSALERVHEVPVWSMTAEDQLRYMRDVVCTEGGGLVANERYLPSEMLPPGAGVTYIIVLRNPIDRLISSWLHDSSNDVDLPAATNFSGYIARFARHEFAVRALCGLACINSNEITRTQYQQARRSAATRQSQAQRTPPHTPALTPSPCPSGLRTVRTVSDRHRARAVA
jgi:hypothetical protein